jgi:hypothetical protein
MNAGAWVRLEVRHWLALRAIADHGSFHSPACVDEASSRAVDLLIAPVAAARHCCR